MSQVIVNSFSLSLDGYGAGTEQSLAEPLGLGGKGLHPWLLKTRTIGLVFGSGTGETGPADDLAARGFRDIGAWILGRNMFGPVRGPWPDDEWKGWWGDEPPYHCPVFVLTHHARPSLTMAGGTVFHFVTEGIDSALERAREAAQGRDVRIGGGVSTIRQYLKAGHVDELHLAISPVLLGRGEHLLGGLDLPAMGFACAEHLATPDATHVVLRRPSTLR